MRCFHVHALSVATRSSNEEDSDGEGNSISLKFFYCQLQRWLSTHVTIPVCTGSLEEKHIPLQDVSVRTRSLLYFMQTRARELD